MAASALAILVGALVLAGWAWDIERLKRVFAGLVAMNPMTAVSFLLAGVSLWLQSGASVPAARRFARLCALLILCIGLLKLADYLLGRESGIDQLLFTPKLPGDTVLPNRIAPNTALGFVILGLALLLLDLTTRRGWRPSELFAVATALVALLALTGYAYKVQWLYGVGTFIPMALHTAAVFLLLSLGVLCARPGKGFMAVVTGDSGAGLMWRRLFPGTVLVLIALGWLRIEGERRGLYGTELGVALHTTATVTILGALIWWSTRSLDRAEAARRRSEAERERFFTLSLDMLCIAGSDGYFKRLNPAFNQTLGYTTEELLARPFLEFVHPDDRAATLAEMDKLSRGQPTLQFENRYQCKDGSWKWLSWRTQPFPSEGLLYATARDITELKRAEAELLAANRFLDSVIENIPDMIFVKEAGDLRFVRVNRAGEELLGYSRSELLGRNDYDFFPKEQADGFTARDREVLQDRVVKDIPEEPIRTRHKGERILHTKKIPIADEHDRPRYLLGISEDVTERKEKEREIFRLNEELAERAKQLEAATRELESFSYSVSHDLRAPLRHIDGYIEMLTEEAGDALSVEARRHLQVITDASRRMGQLIDDLLEFSRMGRAELHEERVDLDALVREAMRGLEMATRGRAISWNVSPLPVVTGDPSMLGQVLANLLSNAVKYTRGRSPAQIEIGRAGEENGRLVFYVRDNGAGFDMKYADKLFGVFQRLHRQDEFEGTGIGLANVRRIIARHGGRVWAEAAPDKGATFFFTLKPAP